MSASARLSIPTPRQSVESAFEPDHAGGAGPPARALSLWHQARTCLHDGESAGTPGERYVSAYLAAVRAATAIIMDRTGQRDGSRPTSVWRLLTESAPEFREWAALFAASSQRRAAAEAGAAGVSAEAAEELLHRAGEFLSVVGRTLLGATR